MQISPTPPMGESYFNPMPFGQKKGDIAYWDPDAGDTGAWIIVTAPEPNPEDPFFLKFGGELFWGEGFENGISVNDMLRWDGEKWNILPAPTSGSTQDPTFLKYTGGGLFWGEGGLPEGTSNGDILYYDGSEWKVFPAVDRKSVV